MKFFFTKGGTKKLIQHLRNSNFDKTESDSVFIVLPPRTSTVKSILKSSH